MFDIDPNRKKRRDLFDFDNFFSEFFPDNLFPSLEGRMMRLDIKESDTNFIFEVELPGINKENINLSINEDILTISVNKTEVIENEENTKYIRRERKYGSYSRSFAIPNIDTDNIQASFNNGILTLILPKTSPQTTPKKSIPIK